MSDFTVRTAQQLPALLVGFRKQAGLTQAAAAMRLGITQQTLSALERNAGKVSAERLLQLLSLLGVEFVLREAGETQPPRHLRPRHLVDRWVGAPARGPSASG